MHRLEYRTGIQSSVIFITFCVLDILTPNLVLVTRHAHQSDGQVEPEFVLPSTHVFSTGLRPVIDLDVAGWSALRLVLHVDINCDHHLPAWLMVIGYGHGVPNCRASLGYFSLVTNYTRTAAPSCSLPFALSGRETEQSLGFAAWPSAVNDPRTWFTIHGATVHRSQRAWFVVATEQVGQLGLPILVSAAASRRNSSRIGALVI